MTQDVTQWLEEIKSLQQQLSEAQRDRDAAQASAENWRNLYNTEAQQRRTEAKLAQQTIESLKAEIQQLQEGQPHWKLNEAQERSRTEQELAQLPSGELKAKLLQMILERDRLLEDFDRLSEALKTEQAAHVKTRQSLTTALGDTMDRLKATRSALMGGEGAIDQAQNSPPEATASSGYSTGAPTRTPSLQLPPIKPDRDPA